MNALYGAVSSDINQRRCVFSHACLLSTRMFISPGMPGDAWRIPGIRMWSSWALYS